MLRRSGDTGSDGVRLEVRVQPGSSRDEASFRPESGLLVRLKAPAVEGKANARLVTYLAKIFDLRQADVEIAAGRQSRRKSVLLHAISPAAVQARLESLRP